MAMRPLIPLVNDQSRRSNCINYLGKILELLSKNVFELIELSGNPNFRNHHTTYDSIYDTHLRIYCRINANRFIILSELQILKLSNKDKEFN